MTARFANVDMTMEDTDGKLANWIESHLSLSDLRAIAAEPIYSEASRPQWLPVPNYHRSPGVHLNSLYWPTGASRWSVGHFLATTVQKNTIVNNLNWSSSQSGGGVGGLSHFVRELSGWLEFGEPPIETYDDRGEEQTTKHSGQKICVKMFMLPPVPLTVRGMANPKFKSKLHPDRQNEVTGDPGDQPLIGGGPEGLVTGIPNNTGEGIWLIPLVDARWYWQMMSVGGIWAEQLEGTGAEQQNQWNQTIKSIADTLGVNIFHLPIEDAYGEIDEDFAKRTSFHNAAYILDGIAYSTDRRLVHNWSDMGRERQPQTETEQGGGGVTSNWESREFQLLTHDQSLDLARENYERKESTISERVPLGTDVYGNQSPNHPRDIFDNPQWTKQMVAGDDFSNNALDYNGAVVPQFVTVVFRKCIGNRSADPPETYSKRYEYNSTDVEGLSDLFDIQLNQPRYVYWGTEKVIRVAAWAKFSSGNTTEPTNNTDLEALAKKLALEHYKSLRLFHNYSLGSVEFWAETGYDDSVIYNFGRQRDKREESGLVSKEYVASTRVQSREFNHGVDELFNQIADCGLGSSSTDPVVDQACCGGCAPSGFVDECEHCDDGAPTSYTFQLWDQPTASRGETADGCCNQLAFPQFLYHGEDCTWNGLELDQCDDSEPPSAPFPKWVLNVNGDDPYDVSLSITLPGKGLNGADAIILYKNKHPWCCNCQNEMILICPTALPVECTDIPCNVCIGPGVACCPNAPSNLTATISDNQNCGCADGETVSMVWDSVNKKWVGQKVLCSGDGGQGHTLYLELVCTAEDLTAGIGGCSDYRLTAEWLDNCAAAGTYSPVTAGDNACDCDDFKVCYETIAATNCCNSTTSSSGSIGICIT